MVKLLTIMRHNFWNHYLQQKPAWTCAFSVNGIVNDENYLLGTSGMGRHSRRGFAGDVSVDADFIGTLGDASNGIDIDVGQSDTIIDVAAVGTFVAGGDSGFCDGDDGRFNNAGVVTMLP